MNSQKGLGIGRNLGKEPSEIEQERLALFHQFSAPVGQDLRFASRQKKMHQIIHDVKILPWTAGKKQWITCGAHGTAWGEAREA